MKIIKLKINGFGKLKEKEIELGTHINVIYGKNESGKSTILKFIVAMLYGLSKNKNGKTISDQERYTPWTESDFSGKLSYRLENGEVYEVFREFKKKNPKIFNENMEDISQQFNIDKTNGITFFQDQTKVPEEIFLSTIVSEQGEVQIGEKEQTSLIQKMSNQMGTGEDSISFQKIMNRLAKRQLEEIGTSRSLDRPINMLKKRQQEIQLQKRQLEQYQIQKEEIEKENQKIIQQIQEKEKEIDFLNQIKQIQETKELEQEKIKINQEICNNYEEQIQQLNKQIMQIMQIKQIQKTQKREKSKSPKLTIAIITILIILATSIFFLLEKKWICVIPFLVAIGYGILSFFQNQKEKNQREKEISNQIIPLKKEIELLEKNKEIQQEDIKRKQRKLEQDIEVQLEKMAMYNQIEKEQIKKYENQKDITVTIETMQEELNQQKIQLHTKQMEQQNAIAQLEHLVELEEEEQILKEQEEDLKFQEASIELAKEEIEKAYIEMKSTITPKFTQNLSNVIEKISNGKYQKVKFNEENGIIVEIANGNYISAKQLSIGTIDQLYLALRLGAGEEISTEELPIILDEAFAYYDKERLQNIITYLHKEYPTRQIIIFTCTDREKQVLEEKNILYDFIVI